MKISIIISAILLVTLSCKKETPEPKIEVPPAQQEAAYFISFKIDGANYFFGEGIEGYTSSNSNGGSIDSQNSIRTVDFGAGLVDLNTFNSNTISFDNNEFSFSDYYGKEADAIASACSVGTYKYEKEGSNIPGSVSFDFVPDANSEIYWSSKFGEQNSSAVFAVTSSEPMTNGVGDELQLVQGNFNCTLFNEDGIDPQNLTEGKFKLIFTTP